jgi:hypothetical protein
MHPEYNYGAQNNNDIALIKVTTEIPLGTSMIDKIALPDQDSDMEPGAMITVTGWGYLIDVSGVDSDTLQTVDVPVVYRADCANDYSMYDITENMSCAGYDQGGMDACTVSVLDAIM